MAQYNSLTQEATLKQRTTLTPLQIQEIRILEYPMLELEQRIEREIEENPGLERGPEEDEHTPNEEDYDEQKEDALSNDDFDLNDYISDDDDVPEYRLHISNQSADDKQEDIPFSVGESFQEHLLSQLGLLKISQTDQRIARYVIGNIDDDGYLRRDAESLVDDLVFHANISVTDEQMKHIISLIQDTFEPAGICAHDLQECLILQLKRKPETEDTKLAMLILKHKYKEFTAHHYHKIKERYNLTDEQLKSAIAEITKLNPKPGNTYSNDVYNNTSIIPDFIVEDEGNGNLNVMLNNGNVPEMHVNQEFNQMLEQYQAKTTHTKQEREAISFIKDRIDSARWFIDAINQRNQTLLRTMRAIVKLQHDFFVEGDELLLKPMILKDIADITGYDVSTISRVSNSKYVQTNYGVFPLKYFFSESMTNDSGEEVATKAIKNALSELINNEDKKHPLNDDELVTILNKQGLPIARRTIAKYRKQLNIPVARLRKSI